MCSTVLIASDVLADISAYGPPISADSPTSTLNEVVVTVKRRTERLLDVQVLVTAIDAPTLLSEPSQRSEYVGVGGGAIVGTP
jgi:hypothetical protein